MGRKPINSWSCVVIWRNAKLRGLCKYFKLLGLLCKCWQIFINKVLFILSWTAGSDWGDSRECFQDLAVSPYPVLWKPRGFVSHLPLHLGWLAACTHIYFFYSKHLRDIYLLIHRAKQQAKMAEYCRTIFGDALLIDPLEKNPVRLTPHAPLTWEIFTDARMHTCTHTEQTFPFKFSLWSSLFPTMFA